MYRFCKPLGLRVCAAFGGMQKHAQKRELLGGVEAAVATPGRLIDLVECGACKLERVTMFIVDEVDRCFDLGFEAQVQFHMECIWADVHAQLQLVALLHGMSTSCVSLHEWYLTASITPSALEP